MKKIQATHLKSVAPTTANNISSGFGLGQWWENITTGDKYFHKTDGVWVLIGGGGSGGVTDLSNTPNPTNNTVTNTNGTGFTLPLANTTNAGLLSPTEKSKLSGIAPGAEVNVNADWNATTGDAVILNKPIIPIAPTKTSDLINDGDNGTSHFISLEDLPSNIILYPTTAASTVSGYYKLVSSITDPSYNTVAVDIPTGVITTTGQLIASLVTSPGIIIGNPGIFNIVTVGNITRTSGSGTAEFYFEVYKRTSAGTESLITTSDVTLPVLNTGYSEFSASALWNDGIFLSTDSIVLKFYANRISGGSNPSYQFQFGGTSPVRTLVPVPLAVVPVVAVEQLSNFSDVSYSSVIDTDSLMIKDITTSLWKRFTFDNLKTLIRSTLLTGFSSSNTTSVVATDTILEAIGKLQGQLGVRQAWLVKDSVPTSALTGSTVLTQIGNTIVIPAGTFSANDALIMDSFSVSKIGTSGTLFWRLGHNTTDSISGVNIIASATLTATQITGNMQRTFEINGGLLKNRLGGTTTGFTDKNASTGAGLSISFDPTITNYFFRLATLASATDSVTSPQILLSK